MKGLFEKIFSKKEPDSIENISKKIDFMKIVNNESVYQKLLNGEVVIKLGNKYYRVKELG